MAITLTNSAEGQTSGTTVTVGNSGGGSGNAITNLVVGTGVAVTFDNTHAAHGTNAYKIVTPVTAASLVMRWDQTVLTSSPTTIWGRLYIYLTANPAATICPLKVTTSAGSRCARLVITTAGKLQVQNQAAQPITTSTASIPLNQWFRVEIMVTSSATVGQTELKLFNTADSTTPDETNTSAANQTTFGGAIGRFEWGLPDIAVSSQTIWLDDIGLSDTAYLGPAGTVAVNIAAPAGAATGAATAPAVAGAAALAPPAGAATAAATSPAVTAAASLAPPSGAAVGAATSPAVTAAASLAPPAGAAVAGATAPGVTAAASLAPPAAAATGAATSPTITYGVNVTPPAAAASGDATSPDVSAGLTIAMPASAATGASTAPAITITYTASPPAAAATGDATSPAVTAAVTVYPPAAEAIAAAAPPTITVVAPRDLTVIPGPTVTHYRNGASAGPSYSAGPTASRTSSGPTAGPGYQDGPTATRYRTGATAT